MVARIRSPHLKQIKRMANPENKRVAYSPGEFAALFGKQQTWGYRQIYAGKVKTITEYGRIQIPAAEVERILATADRYNGLKKKARKVTTKAELWKRFLAVTRTVKSSGEMPKRSAALARLRPAKVADGDSLARFKKR